MKQTIRIIRKKGIGYIIENVDTKSKSYLPKEILSLKIQSGLYHLVNPKAG